jgi:dihydrofolate reductase
MLHGQKIIFVSIVDNYNQTIDNMQIRVWHYQRLISRLLKTENCLIGRKTYDLTQWKGPKTWVLTRDIQWHRSNVGTIHDIDDLHLHTEGDIYVLGGNSLHEQLSDYIDEVHLYVLNNTKGSTPWIEIEVRDWKPIQYESKMIWSYIHLEKCKNHDPHNLNEDILPLNNK